MKQRPEDLKSKLNPIALDHQAFARIAVGRPVSSHPRDLTPRLHVTAPGCLRHPEDREFESSGHAPAQNTTSADCSPPPTNSPPSSLLAKLCTRELDIIMVAAASKPDILTVRDERTGKTYSIPCVSVLDVMPAHSQVVLFVESQTTLFRRQLSKLSRRHAVLENAKRTKPNEVYGVSSL